MPELEKASSESLKFIKKWGAWPFSKLTVLLTVNAGDALDLDEFGGAFYSPGWMQRFIPEIDQLDAIGVAKKIATRQDSRTDTSATPAYEIESLTLNGIPGAVLRSKDAANNCENLAYSVVVVEYVPQTFAAFQVVACPTTLSNFESAAVTIAGTLRPLDE